MKNNTKQELSRLPDRGSRSVSAHSCTAQDWAMSVAAPKSDRDDTTAIEPLLVSEESAAVMLGVSPRTVWKLGKEGRIVTGRIGRRKNYSVASLKAYAQSIMEGQ